MSARLVRILAVLLVAGCIAAPSTAHAAENPRPSAQAKTTAETTLRMLESIERIKVGMNTTVVTIQNGPKARPIVIDYGEALQTGVLGIDNDGTSSRLAQGDSRATGGLPRGLTLGQIGALLLGLTLVSRVVTLVRQLVPVRGR